jgi:hypothetical protein
LPKTIRDAIDITRALNERFLFVDAVCIIQPEDDDKEDWVREAPRMGVYYENALVTIAATGSSDSSEGLLTERPAQRYPVRACVLEAWPDPTNPEEPPQEICINPSIPTWWSAIIQAPLYTRGWTMQERALSGRILHFSRDALYWECSDLRASEYRPAGLHFEEMTAQHENLIKEVHMNIGTMKKYSKTEVLGWAWFRLVSRYAIMKFTCTSDRLIALQGLVERVQIFFPDEWVVGLWRSELLPGLGWYAAGPALPSPEKAIAPSWCWTSTSMGVQFVLHGLEAWKWIAEIESVEGLPTSSHHSTGASQGRIRLRGILRTLTFSGKPADMNLPVTRFNEQGISGLGLGKLFFDAPELVPTSFYYIPCLLIGFCRPFMNFTGLHTVGYIMLRKTGNAPNEYARIGWAETSGHGGEWWEALQTEVVELI